jgi:predicted dehydrogenase
MKQNRRKFLKASFLTAASLSIPVKSWSQVRGANERIRVATVGFRSRGSGHISSIRALEASANVQYTALCDVDKKVLDKGVDSFARAGKKVTAYTDIRRLLEHKDLDAVTIATPNHWHALAAIWSIQAGKDVYVEKPVSHNVWEGRQIVKAARKYDRIVQTGTQSRSVTGIKHAVEWVQAGNLGKIKVSRGLCYKPRLSIGNVKGAQPVPSHIDYDIWCGPAPLRPPARNGIHYNWHWIWDYGNGDLGNQGIHQMDVARWFLGETHLAPTVFSVGCRVGYKDNGETPNTQIVYQGYEKAPLIFEVRGMPKNKAAHSESGTWRKNMDRYPDPDKGASIGVVVECEGGNVVVSGSGATAYDKSGKQIEKWNAKVDHFENFLGAVRSRNAADLNADIWEGHVSSALCHTGNISYRLGATAAPRAIKEKIKNQPGAGESFERMAEHLRANEIDLTKDKIVLGEMLQIDPKVEKFLGAPEADKLLTRDYRKPYVVPAHV